MLLSETAETTVTYKNIKRYLDLGYDFPTFINNKGKISVKRGVKIFVKVEDLDKNSGVIIRFKCDYCEKEKEVRFCDYIKNKSQIGEVDACSECGNIKLGDINFEKYGTRSPLGRKEVKEKANKTVKERYGVDNVFQLEETKNKIIETNNIKYGVDFYTQTDEYKNKCESTCLEKYGYNNVSKSPEIIQKIKDVQTEKYGDYYTKTDEYKEKYKESCMKRYGVENAFQSEEVKEKSKETMIRKYGVDCLMKIPEEAKRRTKKAMKTKSKMGILPSSRQQEYLHNLYGGVKNYVVDNCALDIALLDEKIYIEYDGSGHNLRVQFGECTIEEFHKKELRRKYFLLKQDWKEIRIISQKDKIPNDEVLNEMLKISKEWFSKNHTWIKFNIDNNTIETSKEVKKYNYGNLRIIKDKDLNKLEAVI